MVQNYRSFSSEAMFVAEAYIAFHPEPDRFRCMKQQLADWIAQRVVRQPRLERALARICRQPFLRKTSRAGAIALAYARVLSGQQIRVADLGPYRFCVNVAEYLGILPYFFGSTGTVWLASQLVSPGDVCLDVGANAGAYTFLLAHQVGSRGKVIAFEPNPSHQQLLKQSIALNHFEDRVTLEPKAAWKTSEEQLKFYLSVDAANSGVSSLVNHGYSLAEDKAIWVQTVRLDDYADAQGLSSLSLVKLDVERAEDSVVEGMLRLLQQQRIQYLIVEMYSGSAASETLSRFGYQGFLLDEGAQRLRPLGQVAPNHFGDYLWVSPQAVHKFQSQFQQSIDFQDGQQGRGSPSQRQFREEGLHHHRIA